jgi:hypothetical protein
VYRFPFSNDKQLTEQAAIELTKQALILDGKYSATMRPVYSGHKDSQGREPFFCRREDDTNQGWVLWWINQPDHEWEYMVGLTKIGGEVECTISKPL